MQWMLLLWLCSLWYIPATQTPPSLDGVWTRVTDVSTGSLSGVAVWVDMARRDGRIVQIHPNCCFELGDLKWQAIEENGAGGYQLLEMWRYQTCDPAGYYETDLRFIQADEVELSSGGYTTRWVRIPLDNV